MFFREQNPHLAEGVVPNLGEVSMTFVKLANWNICLLNISLNIKPFWKKKKKKTLLLMCPISCPLIPWRGLAFVLRVLVNISSASNLETIMAIVSGLCSCYISPNPLSGEWLHLFSSFPFVHGALWPHTSQYGSTQLSINSCVGVQILSDLILRLTPC